MDSFRSKSFVFALLLAAVVVPASAQQNTKAVVNNADIEAMKKANAFMPNSAFGSFSTAKRGPSFDVLPGGAIPENNNSQQNEAWQKYLEKQKNWTLMTPAEILNVPTPEKILGVPDPDDMADLSPEERYLRRLDQQAQKDQTAAMPTNSTNPIKPVFGIGDGNPFAHEQVNIFRQSDGRSGTNGAAGRNDMNRLWNTGVFQNPTLEIEAQRMAAQGNPLWDTPFAQPPQELKLDQAEQDSMERFRALLEPPKAPTVPTLNQPASIQPVDPNMQVMPAYNPVGSSFTPLQPVGDRPTGLMPIAGPETRHIQTITAKPAWAPKLPPWMNKGPTAGNLQYPQNLPQRVF